VKNLSSTEREGLNIFKSSCSARKAFKAVKGLLTCDLLILHKRVGASHHQTHFHTNWLSPSAYLFCLIITMFPLVVLRTVDLASFLPIIGLIPEARASGEEQLLCPKPLEKTHNVTQEGNPTLPYNQIYQGRIVRETTPPA